RLPLAGRGWDVAAESAPHAAHHRSGEVVVGPVDGPRSQEALVPRSARRNVGKARVKQVSLSQPITKTDQREEGDWAWQAIPAEAPIKPLGDVADHGRDDPHEISPKRCQSRSQDA